MRSLMDEARAAGLPVRLKVADNNDASMRLYARLGFVPIQEIPAYIEMDARARLQAVPKTKQIGYYSDMYKLEFGLPKFNMYRRILAKVLADDFVRPGITTEKGALDLARLVLRDNVRRIFKV